MRILKAALLGLTLTSVILAPLQQAMAQTYPLTVTCDSLTGKIVGKSAPVGGTVAGGFAIVDRNGKRVGKTPLRAGVPFLLMGVTIPVSRGDVIEISGSIGRVGNPSQGSFTGSTVCVPIPKPRGRRAV